MVEKLFKKYKNISFEKNFTVLSSKHHAKIIILIILIMLKLYLHGLIKMVLVWIITLIRLSVDIVFFLNSAF